jgi:hypothetical protein
VSDRYCRTSGKQSTLYDDCACERKRKWPKRSKTRRIGLTSSMLDFEVKQRCSPWNVPGGAGAHFLRVESPKFPPLSQSSPILTFFSPLLLTTPHFAILLRIGAWIIIPPSTPPVHCLRPSPRLMECPYRIQKWYVPFKFKSCLRAIIPRLEAIAQTTALSHDSRLILGGQ